MYCSCDKNIIDIYITSLNAITDLHVKKFYIQIFLDIWIKMVYFYFTFDCIQFNCYKSFILKGDFYYEFL